MATRRRRLYTPTANLPGVPDGRTAREDDGREVGDVVTGARMLLIAVSAKLRLSVLSVGHAADRV
jgi:hypothetical protein